MPDIFFIVIGPVIISLYLLMSIPNSYNPSDYEYLLRSLTEGSQVAKSEALKRFQILASSDKKQFAVYAKRIILALQDLPNEQKVRNSFIEGRNKPSYDNAGPLDHKLEP